MGGWRLYHDIRSGIEENVNKLTTGGGGGISTFAQDRAYLQMKTAGRRDAVKNSAASSSHPSTFRFPLPFHLTFHALASTTNI